MAADLKLAVMIAIMCQLLYVYNYRQPYLIMHTHLLIFSQ